MSGKGGAIKTLTSHMHRRQFLAGMVFAWMGRRNVVLLHCAAMHGVPQYLSYSCQHMDVSIPLSGVPYA